MFKKNKTNKYCGSGKTALFIPQFIFTASCKKHDEYYSRGGGLIDKIKADTFFYAYMLDDIVKGGYSFFKRYFFFATATLYFIMVSLFGFLFFRWVWITNCFKKGK